MKHIKIIGIVGIISSVISMVIGLIFFFNSRAFVKNAIRTEGRIVEIKEVSFDGETFYKSIFTFTDKNNKEHKIVPSTRSTIPAHEVGDAVSVLYNPKNPIKAKIESIMYLWGASIACGANGIASLVLGLVLLLVVPKFVKK